MAVIDGTASKEMRIGGWWIGDARLYVSTEPEERVKGILVVENVVNGQSVFGINDPGPDRMLQLLSDLVDLLVGSARVHEKRLVELEQEFEAVKQQLRDAQVLQYKAQRERDDALVRMDEKAQMLTDANQQVDRLIKAQKKALPKPRKRR